MPTVFTELSSFIPLALLISLLFFFFILFLCFLFCGWSKRINEKTSQRDEIPPSKTMQRREPERERENEWLGDFCCFPIWLRNNTGIFLVVLSWILFLVTILFMSHDCFAANNAFCNTTINDTATQRDYRIDFFVVAWKYILFTPQIHLCDPAASFSFTRLFFLLFCLVLSYGR